MLNIISVCNIMSYLEHCVVLIWDAKDCAARWRGMARRRQPDGVVFASDPLVEYFIILGGTYALKRVIIIQHLAIFYCN